MSDIKVPIRSIVDETEQKYGYNLGDVKLLLRRYFISLLNLGLIEPSELKEVVNKVMQKFSSVTQVLDEKSGYELYKIKDNTIYFYCNIKELYEETMFKAFSEALLGKSSRHPNISSAFNEILSEKAYNVDKNESKIIETKNQNFTICDYSFELESEYKRYVITITLLKQLLLAIGISEDELMKALIKGNMDSIRCLFNNPKIKLLLDILEAVTMLEVIRDTGNGSNKKEVEYIKKYQLLVNSLFSYKNSKNYLAFCNLITSEEIKKKCIETAFDSVFEESSSTNISTDDEESNMDTDNTFTIIGEDGKEQVCQILFTYHDGNNNKDYIAYMDNSLDDQGNTRVFASTYNPNEDNPNLIPIETDEEWKMIESILESLSSD